FEDAGEGRTLYTARVRHWSAADREAHEQMGFHQGWGVATEQLEALAQRI
ncbi:MAG TPA: polyketide cyclase, partial [Acidobacteriota bacterium]|nr:polyketide cyclase [Acidobacteriota bacterium]